MNPSPLADPTTMRGTPRDIEYPQNLLDKVTAAQFKPNPHGRRTDNPDPTWVYVLHHDIDELGTEDGSQLFVEGIFSTLAKANAKALELFKQHYADFFDQKKDMSNFYESGTRRGDGLNTVEWTIQYDGGVMLEAQDAEGPKFTVFVESREVE